VNLITSICSFDLWDEQLRRQHYVKEKVAHDLDLLDKAHQWSKIEGRNAPAHVLQGFSLDIEDTTTDFVVSVLGEHPKAN
jgi:hypothetical protein